MHTLRVIQGNDLSEFDLTRFYYTSNQMSVLHRYNVAELQLQLQFSMIQKTWFSCFEFGYHKALWFYTLLQNASGHLIKYINEDHLFFRVVDQLDNHIVDMDSNQHQSISTIK